MPAQRLEEREKSRVALVSVGAAVLLTALKIVVGLATGSLGILSEAAHSALDFVAAAATLFAVRASGKPADREHHYGHGKIENLSALFETVLLLVTCIWIFTEAVLRILKHGAHVYPTWWAFGVVIISILVDFSRSRALMRVAKKHKSQALEADAMHFGTDIWSSSVVLVGLTLVKIGEMTGQSAIYQRADAIAALVVALIVVQVCIKMGKRAIDVLLDRVPEQLENQVRDAIGSVPGVTGIKDLRLRESGPNTFADVVVEVERNLPLERSHEVSRAIQQSVRDTIHMGDIVVQVDPVASAQETLEDRVFAIAHNRGATTHSVLAYKEGDKTYLDLHMEVPETMELAHAHEMADKIESDISKEMPEIAGIATHIEPKGQNRALDAVSRRHDEVLAIVRTAVPEIGGILDAHEIIVREVGHDLFVTMHCHFPGNMTVREVHALADRLEHRLKAAIPHLARVTIHPEPS